jgi:hypothetical protein
MRVLLAILLAVAAPAMQHTSADTKTAQASLLRTTDLGTGWTGKASPQSGATLGCTGFEPSGAGIVETGAATSESFSYGTIGPFVLQNTSIYANAAEANTYWKRAVTPQLVSCVAQVLQAVAARGVKVTITKRGTLPFSTSLPHTAAYRVVGLLGPHKYVNYVDVILLSKGRTLTVIEITSFKSPPPADFENGIARIVVNRLGGPVA